MKNIMADLELPNVKSMSKIQWKSKVNKSMRDNNKKYIIKQAEKKWKEKSLKENPTWEP